MASYPDYTLTGTLPHGPRDYSRECDTRCEYVMGRANAIHDMRIRYEPRECDTQHANRLRAICEYAMGRANTICDTRIGYAL